MTHTSKVVDCLCNDSPHLVCKTCDAAGECANRKARSSLIHLDHAPCFNVVDSAEPTVRELIHRYYRLHFGRDNGDKLAKQFLDLMEIKEPVTLPATCPYDEWKSSKAVA